MSLNFWMMVFFKDWLTISKLTYLLRKFLRLLTLLLSSLRIGGMGTIFLLDFIICVFWSMLEIICLRGKWLLTVFGYCMSSLRKVLTTARCWLREVVTRTLSIYSLRLLKIVKILNRKTIYHTIISSQVFYTHWRT